MSELPRVESSAVKGVRRQAGGDIALYLSAHNHTGPGTCMWKEDTPAAERYLSWSDSQVPEYRGAWRDHGATIPLSFSERPAMGRVVKGPCSGLCEAGDKLAFLYRPFIPSQ